MHILITSLIIMLCLTVVILGLCNPTQIFLIHIKISDKNLCKLIIEHVTTISLVYYNYSQLYVQNLSEAAIKACLF